MSRYPIPTRLYKYYHAKVADSFVLDYIGVVSYYWGMENELTDLIVRKGKVADGSHYPVVVYKIHTSLIQPAVPHIKLMARTEWAVVDHAFRGGSVIALCENLQDALDVVVGR